MNLLRSHPFLCLAFGTVLLGAMWHTSLADSAAGDAVLTGAMLVVGAPFIAAMRFSKVLFGHSSATPLVGLLLGLVPYLLADWLLQKVRSRRATGSAPAV